MSRRTPTSQRFNEPVARWTRAFGHYFDASVRQVGDTPAQPELTRDASHEPAETHTLDVTLHPGDHLCVLVPVAHTPSLPSFDHVRQAARLTYMAACMGLKGGRLPNVIERNYQWGCRGRRWHRGHE